MDEIHYHCVDKSECIAYISLQILHMQFPFILMCEVIKDELYINKFDSKNNNNKNLLWVTKKELGVTR